jgi:hypothetical protein
MSGRAERTGLTLPQWEIYRHGWSDDARFRVAVCGRRFGKSFLLSEELRRAARLAVARSVGRDNEIWYGAPTFIQGKRVMWDRLKQSIPREWLDGNPLETDCSLRLRSGHVIRIVGLDRHDSLRGSGLWFFAGDEWADCRPEAWIQTLRPMLSVVQGHALFVGTPKGFDHFHEAYLRGQPSGDHDTKSFLYSTIDGGNVPEAEIESARQLLDPRTFRQEYKASFETYAGRVIYAFDRADSIRRSDYDERRPLHVGMDFNINPMSATVWQEEGSILRQIDEIVLPTSNTDEICDELSRRYGRPSHSFVGSDVAHITVYPDPAGAQRRSSAHGRTDIGILKERGFRVVALSNHPLVRDRMNVVNSYFQNADGCRSAFVDPKCVHSIAAYERLAYRSGTNEPDKMGGHDHLVDATGYYLFARQKGSERTLRGTSHSLGR